MTGCSDVTFYVLLNLTTMTSPISNITDPNNTTQHEQCNIIDEHVQQTVLQTFSHTNTEMLHTFSLNRVFLQYFKLSGNP